MTPPPASSEPGASTVPVSRLRLALLAACFVALTAGGVAWALHGGGLGLEQLGSLLALPGRSLAGVLALAVLVLLAEMLRFRVFASAAGARFGWLACWDATVANFFFAWLTPGSALAEPATLVVLRRRGVAWDLGLVVCFGKSFTSFLVLLGTTLVLLGLRLGPRLPSLLLLPFASGTAVLVSLGLLVALGAVWPRRLTAWLARREANLAGRVWLQGPRAQRAVHGVAGTLIGAVERAATLRRLGWTGWLGIALSHAVYYASFLGVLLVLLHTLGATSLAGTLPAAVIYQGFTYVAPTPGGAGLSEATAQAFFGHLLSPQGAVLAVLLFRTVTFYLHIALGLVYLPLIGGLQLLSARD